MLHRHELPRDVLAPVAARRAIDELRPLYDEQTLADARLLVSELVSNGVRHGEGSEIVLLLDTDVPGRLRCEVIDQGHGFVPRARSDEEIGGWGLDFVEKLARSWGVREGSTHVWFELTTDTAGDA
jgi:anti-sigma regulatory factor (Ser/Thr protein kinase)